MSNPIVIEFNSVTKYFKRNTMLSIGLKHLLLNLPKHMEHMAKLSKFYALKDASFYVRKGESLGVIGRNGSGKSTTLSLIANVLKPNEGKVKTSGHICSLLELGAGFHHELNGAENIILNGVLMGMTKKQVKDKFREIVEFSGLEDFLEQPIRTYSSGMLARLGFSVAVHLNPEILLLDEILSVGDIAFTEKCLKKMESFRKQGVTIVLVSHSPEMVVSFCDRAIWLDSGRVMNIGPAKIVCEEYREGMVG